MQIKTNVIWDVDPQRGCYFAPRVVKWKDELLLATQQISGSDHFGPLRIAVSKDDGRNWSPPELVEGFASREIENGINESFVEFTLEVHPPTNTLLAVGMNIFYQDGRKLDAHRLSCGVGDYPQGFRRPMVPVYNRRAMDGSWFDPPRHLDLVTVCDTTRYAIVSCGGGQNLWNEGGDLLMSVAMGRYKLLNRSATTLLCEFDGETLIAKQLGTPLTLEVGRGLIEPSLTRFCGMYYMTLRAEDHHAYLATSVDGMTWRGLRPWRWDSGEPLVTGATQQHWVELSGRLHLVYTRRNEENQKVLRWRSPLYVCEVDPEALCLRRDTERQIFPLEVVRPGDPGSVPRMGNFWVTAIGDDQAIVTVGELREQEHWRGRTKAAFLSGDHA